MSMIKLWCIHLLCSFTGKKRRPLFLEMNKELICLKSPAQLTRMFFLLFFLLLLTDFRQHLQQQLYLWSCGKSGAVEGTVP